MNAFGRGLRGVALALVCACNGEVSGSANVTQSGAAGATHPVAGAVPGLAAPPAGTTSATTACTGDTSQGPRVLRRLARFEYDNSIEDLLGVPGTAVDTFAADTVVNGFDDNADALSVSALLGDQLYTSAENLAALAVKDLGKLSVCAAAANPSADCAQSFVRDFGRRAFRRPLTDAEVARYLDLHTLGSSDGGFSAGIELVLTAMLQSPNFLYRPELGTPQKDGSYALTSGELATELAYTLTGSTPDAMLLDAADGNQLTTPAQLDAQATRLMASPRGRAQLVRFVREWLDLDRLASVPKDAQLFPELTPEIRDAMAREVDHFVEYVAFVGDGTLQALLTAPLDFVDDKLAAFYGSARPAQTDADGFGMVAAIDPERHGVLTLGAVLTTQARPDSSSPILRGKLVRERLLCQPLQPPPPGIIVQPPPVDPKLSVRERFAAHSAKEPCQGCHRLIDPIGFGFEHFDGIGRYRTSDGEQDVDASGQIVASVATDTMFDDAAGLTQALGQSEEVSRCVALEWFRFANGLAESDATRCGLEQMQQRFIASGGKLTELLRLATMSTLFRTRAAGLGDDMSVQAPDDPVVQKPPPGASGADAGVPTGVPAANATLNVMVHTDSSWDMGHCDSVSVRNDGSAPIEWSTQLTIDGKLTNNWNSTTDAQSGLVTFKGVDFNHSLKPGESAMFGYCVSTTG